MSSSICGTVTGERRHRRAGEKPCDPCRLASNAYVRERERLAKICGLPRKLMGTRAGYARHHRAGDVQAWREGVFERCVPCTEANTLKSKVTREKYRDYQHKRRINAKAIDRANRRLAAMFPREYHRIRLEELKKILEEENGKQAAAGGIGNG